MVVHAIWGCRREFGIVAAQGEPKVADLISFTEDREDACIPVLAGEALNTLVFQCQDIQEAIQGLEKKSKT